MGTDLAGSGLPWVDAMDRSFAPYSFVEFHRVDLPALVARRGHLVADDLREAAPLGFRLADGTASFTWFSSDDGLRVGEGDDAADTVVELSEVAFSQMLHELLTPSGLQRTGRARLVRGTLAGWQRWEPAMQTLCSGRPVYSESIWSTLVATDGSPLDLHRRFEVDDDPDDMRHFLQTAGYLHIGGVFSSEEIDRLRHEVEAVRALTTPGDPFSWWSVNDAGDEVVTRINYLGRHSQVLQDLAHDDRLSRFGRLAGSTMRVCDDRLDGPMVFVKHSGVVKGNGDLNWHVDCGIGGHPVQCPLIQAGIQLDVASATNGQVMVLAGSHRCSKHWISWGEEGELPVVALETQPGDLTLHYGDTMHSTPPPTAPGAGRRVLYYKFAEPKTFEAIPPGCHYNDALWRADAVGRVGSRATTWEEPVATM